MYNVHPTQRNMNATLLTKIYFSLAVQTVSPSDETKFQHLTFFTIKTNTNQLHDVNVHISTLVQLNEKLTSSLETGDPMSAALSLASLLLYAAAVVANGDCLDQSEDAVAGPALESTSLNVSHDVNVDLMAA